MKTLIFIHGGESFANHEEYLNWIQTTAVEWNTKPFEVSEEKKRWKIEIAKLATEQGNLVYIPDFPNPQNTKYDEWKLFFDAWIDSVIAKNEAILSGEIILIGTSLGGCFLLKYFSEQNPPQSPLLRGVESIHLIAACIETGDFTAPTNYEVLRFLGNRVHIWHAEDDPVVPFATAKELQKILPEAQTHFFDPEKGYGHFHGIERIPELEVTLSEK